MNALQNTDLVSWMGKYFTPGYDVQLQVNKQISHAFGLILQYEFGKTKYQAIGVLADLNASNLLRRVDNRTEFKWAMHLYAGVGIHGYKDYRNNYAPQGDPNFTLITDQDISDKSIYSQVGAGLRYKLNDKFDLELRGMSYMSGDEEFDGSGKPMPYHNSGGMTAADTEEGRDDNMIIIFFRLTL